MTPKKIMVSIGIISIMILGTLPLFTSEKAEGFISTTLSVGGTGPGNYTRIQDALDDAHNGDTISVYNGVYHENVDVDKSVLIHSTNGPATCSVEAFDPDDHVFEVTADQVTITGFTVTDAQGELKAGICLTNVDHCTISGNTALTNNLGISLGSSNGNTLTTNTVNSNTAYGIFLDSSTGNTLTNNTASQNYYGICLDSSNDNTLTRNTAQSSIWIGISLDSSTGNTLASNTVSNNFFYGISLVSSHSNTLTANTVNSSSRSGIFLDSSSNNTLTRNTVSNNTASGNTYGIYLDSSSGNNIYHNTFMHNSIHATCSGGTNTWDNGSPSGGNYWDTYTGVDVNGDHIGDIPYSIPEGNNRDRFPLMMPYNATTINQLPTCTLAARPTKGAAPLTVTFGMTASDPDGSITTWALDINSDGTADYTGTGNPSVALQHTYTTLGTYTANLTVTDNGGATSSAATVITVTQVSQQNQLPIAQFKYTPASPVKVNTSIEFSDNSTDADGVITGRVWDFGDGSTGMWFRVNHTYRKEGVYTVTLTVTDNDGATDSASLVIKVEKGEGDSGDNGDGGIPGFGFLPLVLSVLGLFFLVRRKRSHG